MPFGMADLPSSSTPSTSSSSSSNAAAAIVQAAASANTGINPSALSASAPPSQTQSQTQTSPSHSLSPGSATRDSSQSSGAKPPPPAPAPAPAANGTSTSSTSGKEKDAAPAPAAPAQHIYDFTKRKGWSGLLLSQLSGTIQFVFSPRLNVVFVSGCVREYLGWEAEEVVERNLVHLLHVDDIQPFFAHIHHAIATRTELAAYTRFRGKDERTPLFEVRGHPYFVPQPPAKSENEARETELARAAAAAGAGSTVEQGQGQGPMGLPSGTDEISGYQCFFAMARPYPSRPAALLDSFLDLKIENEHLRQRLSSLAAPSPSNPGGAGAQAQAQARAYHTAFYLSDPDDPNPLKRDPPSSSALSSRVGSDEQSRKRLKRAAAQAAEKGKTYVCVMCGRTDSPEWRKGPLGAKTLCNACGLRWAKRNSKRKTGGGEGDALAGLLPGVGDDMDGVLPSVVNPPPPQTPLSVNGFPTPTSTTSTAAVAGQRTVNMSAAASGGTVDG
ncbi:hypothetical protein CALVIDRAFT_559726 [Calocera viscosa TUFC12733]|uniref:GATA-domain-containing protein n=1 Tax=Calocera viscosa (strain TUFC12733) TaxID=1330018 RepID=A0A167RMD4_CALVF|nr:hypothetical protein CALVIDRAFT_559726 [Calocera viscosa TUFC12733]